MSAKTKKCVQQWPGRIVCAALFLSVAHSGHAFSHGLPIPLAPLVTLPLAGVITPQQFDSAAGSGRDDAASLQKAVDLATGAGGRVFLPVPPSGHYNVCAAGLVIPDTGSLVIEGASSQVSIRLMPDCKSSLESIITQEVARGDSNRRIRFESFTIDGFCRAKHDFSMQYGRGFSSVNMVYRNVAAGGSNVLFQSKEQNKLGYVGFELDLGRSNLLENVNDPQHECYKTADELPDFNLENYASDSDFTGLLAVNAKIANFKSFGPGSYFGVGTHGWGTSPALRAKYNFWVRDVHILDGFDADGQILAGVRLSGYGVVVKNGIFQNGKSYDKIAGIIIDDDARFAMIEGNGLQSYGALRLSFRSPLDKTNHIGYNN